MSFVNTLPYVSNPIEEFSDFKFVSWEKEIYPRFKGNIKKEEQDFFINLIIENKLKSIIDFGVGGGTELSGIIEGLKEKKYNLDSVEANEVDEEFIFIHQGDPLFVFDHRFFINRFNILLDSTNVFCWNHGFRSGGRL